ncbi:MAG: chorismate synthase, partial [Muribaculaceae bacterium]|nr:chorismate synthase [Muribaculaceae bacterium]
MNQFGKIFRLTAFGESHGPAIGGVIDGVPAGMRIDTGAVQAQLDRRRPGQSVLTTARNEADRVEFLSGFLDGVTLGSPIGFIIRNTDHRSADYSAMADIYRPNHADYTYEVKYGIREVRGGGRASARATASFVVAGAIARQALETLGIEISSEVKSVGGAFGGISEMEAAIAAAKSDGDSVGGIVECRVSGLPAGLGEPLGGKLQAMLAQAMLSVNAVKGFEYGDGFAAAAMHGSEAADEFCRDSEGAVRTRSNHSGGIQGG